MFLKVLLLKKHVGIISAELLAVKLNMDTSAYQQLLKGFLDLLVEGSINRHKGTSHSSAAMRINFQKGNTLKHTHKTFKLQLHLLKGLLKFA